MHTLGLEVFQLHELKGRGFHIGGLLSGQTLGIRRNWVMGAQILVETIGCQIFMKVEVGGSFGFVFMVLWSLLHFQV